jgi:hypothetical protein
MEHATNFYHGDAAPGVKGSAILWCSSICTWGNRQASRSIFDVNGSSLQQFVICHL